MINKVVAGMKGSGACIDDLVIHSDKWEEHVIQLCDLLCRLRKAKFTENLVKSEFSCSIP